MLDLMASVLPTLPMMPPMEGDITPNDEGLPWIEQGRTIVGAVITIGLILSCSR